MALRLNKISKEYVYFFVLLVSGFVNELIQILSHNNFINGILATIYSFFETQCYLYLFLIWRNFNQKKIKQFQIVFFLISLVGFLIHLQSTDITIDWSNKILLLILVVLSVPILTQKRSEHSRSQKLIIVPFIIFSIYYIVLNILMYFLFNKATQPLFVNLYSIITIINFLSYVSYSLAIIWAPKKEQFL